MLKVINLDMGNTQVRRQVTREVRALDGARHPHVVSYHQSFFADGAVTILMEFMDGGTLWDLLQKVGCRGAAARGGRRGCGPVGQGRVKQQGRGRGSVLRQMWVGARTALASTVAPSQRPLLAFAAVKQALAAV